jgi:hypothetical protein
MNNFVKFILISITLTIMVCFTPCLAVYERCCIEPDNGGGTMNLPPMDCNWQSFEEPWEIIEGLPAGTTIELDVVLKDFICCGPDCANCSVPMPSGICETAGGSLGGTVLCFDATLQLKVRGTEELEGFYRILWVPVFCEIHTGPRNPGDPVQSFDTVFYRLQGELFGDPDFCTFRITGGTDFGLPSPGEMTLTKLPNGDFAIDSFFDITYQIEFEGCPGSQLDGYAGTTTATKRISLCRETECCEPTEDGSSCKNVNCPEIGDECRPKTVKYDPNTGYTTVLECECRGEDDCYVDTGGVYGCLVPDNGSGTITLPPMGCEYTSPDEAFMIIEGLPLGTTIEMPGILKDFICCGDNCPVCSLPLQSGECEMQGGSLGGDGHCFEATLDLDVHGTGDLAGFLRHLWVPVSGEIHTGPRNPGDPVQSFDTVFYRLQGELFGDPDFCTFRITGGTDFGLPSPGHTTLVRLPSGDFAVDSFFDITYQIEFEGCPGSQLDGYAGTTTAGIRIKTGGIPLPPTCTGPCSVCQFCEESIKLNGDGTVNISCNCIPDADLNGDGKVNFEDFAIMAGQWLRGTTP